MLSLDIHVFNLWIKNWEQLKPNSDDDE